MIPWKKILATVLCVAAVQGAFPLTLMAGEPGMEVFSSSEDSSEMNGSSAAENLTVPDPASNADVTISSVGNPSAEDAAFAPDFFDGGSEPDDRLSGETDENSSADLFSADDEPSENQVLAGELSPGDSAPLLGASNQMSDNRLQQNYTVWSSPMYSYLTAEAFGYFRVEAFHDSVLVEQYDSGYHQISQKTLPMELSLFGGFFSGSDAYYLVFGQNNTEESNSKEIIRVVKYSKNWERAGSASLYGENTTRPFDGGSLRMTEYGGYLYVRTSHEMYTTSDGLNHQSNLTFQIRISDMAVSDCFSDIWDITGGYISHSFNQFILADDAGNLVTLDHGDAYPRSFVLGKYSRKAGESSFTGRFTDVDLITFQGEIGANSTGASAGGLEYSATHYLTAGNSVTQDAGWSSHRSRNILITATSRSNFSASGTSGLWLTNYSEGSGLSASTPQLVKLSPNRFLVAWDILEGYDDTGKISYVFLDGTGTPVSSVYTAEGYLSDCKPVVSGQNAIWYVTDGQKLTFYTISSDGSFHAEPSRSLIAVQDSYTVTYGDKAFSLNASGPEGVSLTYSSENPRVATVSSAGKVTIKNSGTAKITVIAGDSGAYATVTVTVKPKNISGCQLCFNKIGTIPFGSDLDQYLIVTDNGKILKNGTDYSFGGGSSTGSGSSLSSLAYTVRGVGNYTGSFYESISPAAKPKLHSAVRNSNGVALTWSKVSGAIGYRIFRKEGNGKYKLIATIKSHNTVTWTDTAAAGMTSKLSYRVKAYTKNGSKVLVSTASGAKSTAAR